MLERRALLVAISGIFKAPPERRGGGAEAVANLLWHRAPNTHHERLDGLAGPHREGHGTGQRLVCDLHGDEDVVPQKTDMGSALSRRTTK